MDIVVGGVEDVHLLDPELLQLPCLSPSPLKLKATSHNIADELFSHWLSLPETATLVLLFFSETHNIWSLCSTIVLSVWCFCRSSLWLMKLNLEHQLRVMPPLMFLVQLLRQQSFWAMALPHYLHAARLVLHVSRGKELALLHLSGLLWDRLRNQSKNSFLRFVTYECIALLVIVILVWYICLLDWSLCPWLLLK